jgi:hypothetical protein
MNLRCAGGHRTLVRAMLRLMTALLAALLAAALMALPSAAQPAESAGWSAGPDASGDNTYSGFIDQPAANATVPTGGFNVAGWFVDTSADGWAGADDIQVWQGTMDGGGHLLFKPNFAQARPDVATALGNPFFVASGFFGVVPAGALSTGAQTLSLYAHSPSKGWWFKQVGVNVSDNAVANPAPAAPGPSVSGGALPIIVIKTPKDSETVLTRSDYDITGYALDKNAGRFQGAAGSGIDAVHVYLGDRDNGGAFLGDADLGFSDSTAEGLYGSQFASAGWRLTFHPTQFHANTYVIFAYAHSVVTGKEDVATRYFAIRERQP